MPQPQFQRIALFREALIALKLFLRRQRFRAGQFPLELRASLWMSKVQRVEMELAEAALAGMEQEFKQL